MTNLEKIIDELSNLSVMEVAELSKMLEEKWGVSANAVAPVAAQAAAAPVVEEKTSFDVILANFGADTNKVPVIKEVRAITNLGLAEAKALVESLPQPLKKGANKSDAEAIKAKLEAVGAKVDLQ